MHAGSVQRLVELLQLHARLIKDFQGKLVRVTLLVHHPTDAHVDDHLGAHRAGLMRAVQRAALDGNAQLGRLQNGKKSNGIICGLGRASSKR